MSEHEQHKDPRTGDELTTGEWVSWKVQMVMRRWSFLIAINLAVVFVWVFIDPIWRHPPADVVNYLLSLLAIDIEGVTAMALINQTVHDAVVNRAILKDVRTLVQELHAKVDAQMASRDTKTGRYVKRSKVDGAA